MTMIPRRLPETVMQLKRMGSAHQSRLSFMRTLLRRLKHEHWQFECSLWDIDNQGFGRAVYQAKGPEYTYSLVAFTHDLPDALRSDRVIAEAWDATFTLFDGIPTSQDLDRLEQNVPKQEAGRVTSRELTLSRANRSVRLFNSVVDALASGQQPDIEELAQIGYLMRTTAVYGSGKFGAADRDLIWQRPELSGPFQAEMLTVWLIRSFAVDLVEYLARAKGGLMAVPLDPVIRRMIGVGNSTGLGMAPFLMNHPCLLNSWIYARETAIARVRSLPSATETEIETFLQYVTRAQVNASQWLSQHLLQQGKIEANQADLQHLQAYLPQFDWQAAQPWNRLYQWVEQHLSLEGQELVSMLMLEPYGDMIDALTVGMNADEQYLPMINMSWRISDMCEHLEQYYDWALQLDYAEPEVSARFWYVSEEKMEPRLGERYQEEGSDLEQPLAIGRDVKALYQVCQQLPAECLLSEWSDRLQEHRHVIRRVQQIKAFPYMEIQDNLIAADMLPIDLLRLKLSFFGATKFDPRSDRWVRITMFQHAPFPYELAQSDADDWVYPLLPEWQEAG